MKKYLIALLAMLIISLTPFLGLTIILHFYEINPVTPKSFAECQLSAMVIGLILGFFMVILED